MAKNPFRAAGRSRFTFLGTPKDPFSILRYGDGMPFGTKEETELPI